MRLIKILLTLACIIIFAFFALAFISHNPQSALVDPLFFPPLEAKLAFWLIGFFIAGGFCGLLVSVALLFKEKAARIRLERRMRNTSKIISGYTT